MLPSDCIDLHQVVTPDTAKKIIDNFFEKQGSVYIGSESPALCFTSCRADQVYLTWAGGSWERIKYSRTVLFSGNSSKSLTYPNLIDAVAPDFFLIGTTSKKQDEH